MADAGAPGATWNVNARLVVKNKQDRAREQKTESLDMVGMRLKSE